MSRQVKELRSGKSWILGIEKQMHSHNFDLFYLFYIKTINDEGNATMRADQVAHNGSTSPVLAKVGILELKGSAKRKSTWEQCSV